MDLSDFAWDLAQKAAIKELRDSIAAKDLDTRTVILRQMKLIELLQQESNELHLRVGVLTRLLVQQGAISADQYAAAVSEAKAGIALAKAQVVSARVPPRARPARQRAPKSS
jgi:hypothetical protein